MYRAAVREGSDIKWQCILCEHPNAKSTMEQKENMSLPDAESTRVKDMSHAEPDPDPFDCCRICEDEIKTLSFGYSSLLLIRGPTKTTFSLY